MKYRKIKIGKQYKNRTNLMLFLLFTCFTLCLSVGYAALNRELKISGEATFRVDADIRITSVSLYETENVGLENFNTSKVKTFVGGNPDWDGLFTGCTLLKSLDLSGWDITGATDIRNMFRLCESLEYLNISTWNGSNIQKTRNMFSGCKSLLTLDMSSFDFSSLTDYGAMFYGITSDGTIYVKDDNSKTFVNKLNSNVNCVIKNA